MDKWRQTTPHEHRLNLNWTLNLINTKTPTPTKVQLTLGKTRISHTIDFLDTHSRMLTRERERENEQFTPFHVRSAVCLSVRTRWTCHWTWTRLQRPGETLFSLSAQVQSYRASAFARVKSVIGENAKVRLDLGVWPWSSAAQGSPARKCHPQFHFRSRPRPNSSISLSTAPSRCEYVRALSPPRPADLETSLSTPKPSFLPIFAPTYRAITSERAAFTVTTATLSSERVT